VVDDVGSAGMEGVAHGLRLDEARRRPESLPPAPGGSLSPPGRFLPARSSLAECAIRVSQTGARPWPALGWPG
jgi:hypothetical protein